jgi:hypothetical protein
VTLPESPGPGWIENAGSKPEFCKRVRVLLRKGTEPTYDDRWNPMSPSGWAVDTTNWALTGADHDVAWFLPL